MKRIIMMVLKNILFVPWGWFMLSKYAANVDKYTEGEKYALLKKIDHKANVGGNITVKSYGVENIPNENGFMFYPNHQGLYDVLVFLDSCPRPFAFVAKKEVRNVILLKQVMQALGSYAIDREDIKQSMQIILKMAEEVKAGKNFLIFAEGTRSKMGNRLNDFKGGSFKSAVKAKCPIVPCALIDSFKPFDENSIQPVTVKVIYMKPLYYEEYKDMKTVDIAAEVKRRIEKTIKEYSM